ncbi:MAG: hypothetical protein Ct9H300mP12_17740 [Acidimicrobiales bacterium]|nr:MAG: hypothetical protein Ct9H300mP12_17740 [Acidimicrobiales bacterium]
MVTADSDEGLYTLRHSTAHVLAQAVLDLWPGATHAIGPPIEHGFYYDFELPGVQFSRLMTWRPSMLGKREIILPIRSSNALRREHLRLSNCLLSIDTSERSLRR